MGVPPSFGEAENSALRAGAELGVAAQIAGLGQHDYGYDCPLRPYVILVSLVCAGRGGAPDVDGVEIGSRRRRVDLDAVETGSRRRRAHLASVENISTLSTSGAGGPPRQGP